MDCDPAAPVLAFGLMAAGFAPSVLWAGLSRGTGPLYWLPADDRSLDDSRAHALGSSWLNGKCAGPPLTITLAMILLGISACILFRAAWGGYAAKTSLL